MLAARLVGERQFGLSALVETFLGVKLDKGSQKADWARRPLTERMEKYARNDTHYLKPLADKLKLELERKGRLAWHQESCATDYGKLKAVCNQYGCCLAYQRQPRVEPPGVAVLRGLWEWRESEAIAANRPPFSGFEPRK